MSRYPNSITLREIRYVVTEPGRKHDPYVILTTMFDEEGRQEVSYEDIAELFNFRWNAELDLRSIKTQLNLRHLRCKSPEMVRREFWTTIIAYNAIRMTAARSAQLAGESPRKISFGSTCQYVLAAWDMIVSGVLHGEALRAYVTSQSSAIAKCIVGRRPGRFEPRVQKKHGSNDNLMMKPCKTLRRRLAVGDDSFETK